MNMVNFESDVCALTDTGLVRSHNEDANRIERTHNGDLFVVCDGMGGHVGGATASKIGVDSICQYVMEHECSIPQQFLVKALEYANGNIYKESRLNPKLKGMGTTACVALVRGDKVWYAHVGDSRIYYYNVRKNTLYRLTKDHSVVQALVDQGIITEKEAEHHPEKNKIRKSLGIKASVEAEPCQMPLLPSDGDILLICSDGLSGMMEEDDILDVLSNTSDVNEAGKTLVELAKTGGGTDNITVQIVRFSGIGERNAIFDAKNSGINSSSPLKRDMSSPKISHRVLIIAISFMLLIAAMFVVFGIQSSKKEIEPQMGGNDTIIVEEYAYTKELTEAERVSYKTNTINGKEYHYFERENRADMMVDWATKDYYIGDFELVEIGEISYFNPYKNKDGSETMRYRYDGTKKEGK